MILTRYRRSPNRGALGKREEDQHINTQEYTAADDRSVLIEDVKECLERLLQLGSSTASFNEDTRLLGEIPELDSMAVLTLITGLEEHFGFIVDDDEISAESFETVGSLADLVQSKIA